MGRKLEFVSERFDSTERFCRYVETAPVNDAWTGAARHSITGSFEFTGTTSLEQAVSLARNGWDEPVKNMKELTRSKSLNTVERVGLKPSRPVNSYIGGSPNVARAIIGLPRDMRRVSFEEKKLPGITIVYETGVPAFTDKKDIEEHGTRFLALVNVLEASGVPTRAVVSVAVDDLTSGLCGCEVVIKDFGKPLNVKKAAFFLANASFVRRLFFAWVETSPIVTEFDYGYGHPVINREEHMDVCRKSAVERGERWYSYHDFDTDEDIVRKYENLKRR